MRRGSLRPTYSLLLKWAFGWVSREPRKPARLPTRAGCAAGYSFHQLVLKMDPLRKHNSLVERVPVWWANPQDFRLISTCPITVRAQPVDTTASNQLTRQYFPSKNPFCLAGIQPELDRVVFRLNQHSRTSEKSQSEIRAGIFGIQSYNRGANRRPTKTSQRVATRSSQSASSLRGAANIPTCSEGQRNRLE